MSDNCTITSEKNTKKNPDISKEPTKERRINLRRTRDRQFWKNTVRYMVVLNLLVLLGVGYEVASMNIIYKELVKDNARHEKAITELFASRNKGKRFTAGNAWQLTQLIMEGEVDMDKFPKELNSTYGTWLDEWLHNKGMIKIYVRPEREQTK